MIYFLQPVDGGPVKIGFSDDVPARVRQLESHYGKPLAVLATLEGGRPEEREIHDRFSHLRFGRTEQFRPVQELMAFIGRPLLVGPNPEAVEVMDGSSAVTNIRSSPEWKAWLLRFADHTRKDLADVIDEAVLRYARAEGFELPPKR